MQRWRWRAAIGIAVFTMSCYEGVTGPGNQAPSRVAVTVTLPPATPAIWFPTGETLHLTVRRAGRTDAIVDTALMITDSLRGTVTVPLAQSIERFVATGEILYGNEVFFLGFNAIQLRAGVDTAITLTATYVGPGANAAAFTLAPRDSALRKADTTRLLPTVTDSLAQVIANVPVRYRSARPTVLAVDSSGVVQALVGGRDTASIDGYLPMGLESATELRVVPTPTTLTIVSGDGQTGPPGAVLPESLVVQLTDETGQPLPGSMVQFVVDAGSGTVVPDSAVTDAAGHAAAQWTLGSTVGAQGATAAVEGRLTAHFGATASRSIAAVVVSPATATLTSYGSFQQFDAVAEDSSGAVVSGITFTWTSSDQNVATIDTAGLATTTGIGTTTITATSGGVSGTASLVVASPTCSQCLFVIVTGDQQTAPASSTLPTALSAQLDNSLEQPVPGVSVTFTVDVGDGSVTPLTVTSDASGMATTTWTLGAPVGPQHVTVSAPGATSSQFTATALGVVRSVVVTPDSDTLTAIPSTVRLTAQARDSVGNPVTGKTFVWATDNPAVATVDASGLVTAAGNGVATITATTDYVSGTANVVIAGSPFTQIATMNAPRRNHTATLLADGTVLIAGGIADATASTILSSAERFDPTTGTFTPTAGAMTTPRAFHTATRLTDGTVLVVGGDTAGSATYPQTATAERYDPTTGGFTATDSLIITGNPRCLGRKDQTATGLPDGTVLIAGGVGTAEAQLFVCAVPQEIYDPTAGTFAVTDSTALGTGQTATLLQNGKVLLVGGTANPSGAWLYDPASGTLMATGSLNTPRQNQTATLLPDGRVLIAGGWINAPFTYPVLNSAELYDPATGTFTPTGNMNGARAYHAAALLQNGKVLLAGGTSNSQSYLPLASAELYDPATGTFTAIADMHDTRMDFRMTLLNDGRVLITGGLTSSSGVLASAEIYTP